MFERFTQEARQVVVLAQEEARGLRHNYIGTEHVLLGLLRAPDEVTTPVLRSFGFTADRVRAEVLRVVGSAEEPPGAQIPFTPRAKKVLELSLREALGLGDNYIGPGHLLLGLLQGGDSVATRILIDSGADPKSIRQRTIDGLAALPSRPSVASSSSVGQARPMAMTAPRRSVDADWLGSLGLGLEALSRDIRRELGRAPDSGDLLVALACARGTLAAETLGELGVDLDELWGRVETARRAQADVRAGLEAKLTDVHAGTEAALEANDYQRAAALRDEARELAERLRELESAQPGVSREIRRRLGIPG